VSKPRIIGWTGALLLATSGLMLAQGPLTPRAPKTIEPPATGPLHGPSRCPLVLIPVHVTTAGGTSVPDLTKESFRLFDDDVVQKITYFAEDDAPVSVGLLFDTSASMQHKMRRASDAAASFLQTANAEDEFFLIEFNDRPKLTVPFTNDSERLYRRFLRAGPFGRTSLLDAIHLASLQIKNAHNTHKAILIISDGGDNHSRLTSPK